MTESLRFEEVWEGVRARDGRAEEEVFRRFVRRLVRLAQKHLATWLHRKEDPEDVVQSVYRSFFLRCRSGEFELGGWDDLWNLLAVITIRKCANRRNHYLAQYQNVLRERPLPGGAEAVRELTDAGPTPEEAVMLLDGVCDLLARLEPPERRIIELTLQGYDSEEISRRVGRSVRTVQRVRAYVRQQLTGD